MCERERVAADAFLLCFVLRLLGGRRREKQNKNATTKNPNNKTKLTRERHDRHRRVLPRPEPVEPHELDRPRRRHGPLRVHEQVQERVQARQLVEPRRPHRLLAHRALVSVARGLVVVGEGDQAADDAHDGEGLDLEVGVARAALVLVHGDKGGCFFFCFFLLSGGEREKRECALGR